MLKRHSKKQSHTYRLGYSLKLPHNIIVTSPLIIGLIVFLFFINIISTYSQYANSWITFNQSYYKISVARDGIYKLTYSDLQSAQFPVNSVDPQFIKLYHRGIEQSIYIQGETDGVFNSTDYIEFYGQKNDGTLDKNLYKPTSAQPHNYYNLYSDTTAYFLTYSTIPPAGKRMTIFSEINLTNLPKENFHQAERLMVLGNHFSAGYEENNEFSNSYFDKAEGWMGNPISQNSSVDYVLDQINDLVPSAGVPKIEIMLAGRSDLLHDGQIWVGPDASSLRSVASFHFTGFETPVFAATLNWSDIDASEKIVVRTTTSSSTSNRPQISVAYIKITFPQGFNATGVTEKKFTLQPNPNNKSYLEINKPAPGFRIWDITNPDHVSTLGTQLSGDLMTVVVSNTATPRNLYASHITNTPSINPVSFRSIPAATANYIIITNRVLLKPAGNYTNAVQAYASYRASTKGGKYDTLTVTIDQLYNQFNFGETSPLAIFEFMKYLVGNGNPKYLFLVGKGRDIYNYSPYKRKPLQANEMVDLVPSSGYPASDIAYSAHLGGTTYDPRIATGRLPASTPLEVINYLDKIKELEDAPLASDWKKQGLHLSGGIEPDELPLFKSYVNGFKTIAEGKYWGANITSIAKRDAVARELINISTQINKGVNLVTFFGHSSPYTIDFDIGFASDPIMGYNNVGKYPVFLINGCNAGAFFMNDHVFGEDWILSAHKGARNFIAHASFGFSDSFQTYSNLFYQIGFSDALFVEQGVGDVQKEISKKYLALSGNTIFNTTLVQQMLLLGDPSVKLFGTANPDFSIDDAGVSIVSLNKLPITTNNPSLGIKIICSNLGAVSSQPLLIRVIRTLSNQTTVTYDSLFNSVSYRDTVIFKIKKESHSEGINQFTIVLDPNQVLSETSTSNNQASITTSIPSNATKNLYPPAYSIVNSPTVEFLFQATQLFSSNQFFQIQVDTSYRFDSPFIKTKTVSGNVLAKTTFTLLAQDSATYYWRTKLNNPQPNESSNWYTSSFTYIQRQPDGWGQLQFPQLIDNSTSFLWKDLTARKLKYTETVTPVSVTTLGSRNPNSPAHASIKIDQQEYNLSTQGQPCRNNTINIVAFHKDTTIPYAGIPFNFQDPRTCGREPQVINSFLLSELETGANDDLTASINAIQQSDSVVLFSIGNPTYQSWSFTSKSKLGELGISMAQLNALQNEEPVIIFGRKGAAVGSATIIRANTAPANAQSITVSKSITGKATSGVMKSVLIGPAKNWIRCVHQVTQIENSDQVNISIYGVNAQGTETLLAHHIPAVLDLSFINASTYPFLKLELSTQDPVHLSTAQLKKWIVAYESVAEGVLICKSPSTVQEVKEGENFTSTYAFVNISNTKFDRPIDVHNHLFNSPTGKRVATNFTIAAPAPSDTTTFSITIPTKGKAGLNDISVFVNPRILPEQDYDNNMIVLTDYVNVTGDKTPPVLLVSVDQRTLRQNDYVAPNPVIKIEVIDENRFLFKSDTMGIKIFMKKSIHSIDYPYEAIYFSRKDVGWYAADRSTNFTVLFKPQNLTQGTYTLRVEGSDESGNPSDVKPYEITFNVTDQTTVALQTVYPIPSSSSFNFNFMVSGNTLPDDFSLQIFSVNGSEVAAFNLSDISQFVVGTNELIWNGRDRKTGNGLPDGVYIYKMNVSSMGTSYRKQGKLIIVR